MKPSARVDANRQSDAAADGSSSDDLTAGTAVSARVGAAVRVTMAATIITGALQALVMVALARLLCPADYGAYALAFAMTGITTTLTAGAIERSLIVEKYNPSRPGLPWMISTIVCLVAAITWLVAALAKQFFANALALPILMILLGSGVISSLSILPRVVLRRRLAFGGIAVSEVTSRAIGNGLVAIALAKMGFGAHALAGGLFAQSLISTAVLLTLTRHDVQWTYSSSALRSLVTGTIRLGKMSSLEVLHAQGPAFIVGRLGLGVLGTFNRAYNLVQLPVEMLTMSMSRVLVSGLVAVSHDEERVARGLRSLVMVAAAIITPTIGGIIGAHHQVTVVVLGPRWRDSSEVLPLLALTTWFMMTAHLFAITAEAMRLFTAKIRIQLVSSTSLALFMLYGSKFGLFGACAGMAAAAAVFLFLNICLAIRNLPITLKQIWSWLRPGIVAGVGCTSYTWLLSQTLTNYPPELSLGFQVFGCALLSLGYYTLAHRDLAFQIVASVKRPA